MEKLPKIVREIGDALAKGGFNDLSPKAQAWVVDRINEHGYAPEIQNLGGLRDASFGAFAVGMGRGAPPYARTAVRERTVSPVDYVRSWVDPPPFDEDDLIDDMSEFDPTGHEEFHQIFDTVAEREPELDDDGYPIEPWLAALGDEDIPLEPWYLPLTPLSGVEDDGFDVGAGTWGLPPGCGPTPLRKFALKAVRDAYVAQWCGTSPLAQQSLLTQSPFAAQQQALLAQQQLAAQAQALAPPAPAVDPMAMMAQMQQMQAMAQMMNPQAAAPAYAPPPMPAPMAAPALAPDPSQGAAPTPAPTPKPHHHKKGFFKRIEDFFLGDDEDEASGVGFAGGNYNWPNCGPNAGQPFKVANTPAGDKAATALIAQYSAKYCKTPSKPAQSDNPGGWFANPPTPQANSSSKLYYLTPTCNAGPTPGKRFSYTAAAGHQAAAQQAKAAYEAQWCQSVPGFQGNPAYSPSYNSGPTPYQQSQIASLQEQLAEQQLAQQQAIYAPPAPAADPMAQMQEMAMMAQMMAPQAPAAPVYAPPPQTPSAPAPTDTGTPAPEHHKHKSLFKRIEDFFLGDDDDAPDATPPTGATAIEHGSPESTRLAIARERALAVQNIRGVAVFESLELGAAALVDVARRVTAESTSPAPGLEVGSWTDSVYDAATNPLVSPAGWLMRKGTEWFEGPSSEATATYQGLRADWAGYEAQGIAKYPDLGQDIAEWNLFKTQWEAGTIPNEEIGGRLTGEVLRSNRVRSDLVQKQTGKFTAPQDIQQDLRQGLDVTQSTNALKAAAKVDAVAQKIPIINDITKPSNTPGLGTPLHPGVIGKLLWYTAAAAAGATVLVVAKDVAVARLSR